MISFEMAFKMSGNVGPKLKVGSGGGAYVDTFEFDFVLLLSFKLSFLKNHLDMLYYVLVSEYCNISAD